MSALASAACGGGEARPEAAALPPAPAETAAAPVTEVTPPAAAPRTEVAPAPRPAKTSRPAGSMLSLELRSAVASDVSQVEDSVRAALREPVVVNGREVLPKGTEVVGSVTAAEQSGRVKGRARIEFEFTSLRYDSEAYRLRTDPIERMAQATKGKDATKIGVGAGAGAALGALLGGGKGAAKGAAIGAAAGTGVVMATKGEEVRLEPGEPVDARLTSPLAIRVRVR
jgi:hypothetical protein